MCRARSLGYYLVHKGHVRMLSWSRWHRRVSGNDKRAFGTAGPIGPGSGPVGDGPHDCQDGGERPSRNKVVQPGRAADRRYDAEVLHQVISGQQAADCEQNVGPDMTAMLKREVPLGFGGSLLLLRLVCPGGPGVPATLDLLTCSP